MIQQDQIQVIAPNHLHAVATHLPASKSTSNRLLIIRALAQSNALIENLSTAEDTAVLEQLLKDVPSNAYCADGGTTIRFLTACYAAFNKPATIYGSAALNQRPIGPLVDALRQLGAEIEYGEKEGYPPLLLKSGIKKGDTVTIDSSVSSQFISALMLIAPVLEGGLHILMKGQPVSTPYLHTTAQLMRMHGAEVVIADQEVQVSGTGYQSIAFSSDADWSSASYWYGLVACMDAAEVFLPRLKKCGMQGDEAIADLMVNFGVETIEEHDGIRIRSTTRELPESVAFDLEKHPDLAQTIAVTAAVKGIACKLKGLSTLRIKETDRIAALATELTRAGVHVIAGRDSLELSGKVDASLLNSVVFSTYNDHRMALSLSILSAAGMPIVLQHPEVVKKSYPGWWDDLKQAGFSLKA